METKLIYKRIKSDDQYSNYINKLEELDIALQIEYNQELYDEIELIQLLVLDYEEQYLPIVKIQPVQVIKLLMSEHSLNANQLASELQISKSVISEILSNKKSISKNLALKISDKYKINLNKLLVQ